MKVSSTSPVPSNWSSFLRVDENKAELFNFLARQISSIQVAGKMIISTLDTDIICSSEVQHLSMITPCSHEEGDTRIMLHVAHCVHLGLTRICLRTVDTDVVVLAVNTMAELDTLNELWVAFGTLNNFRYIPAHTISHSLGMQKSRALLMIHALTGCDTVSSFSGRGKKSAWETWTACPAVTPTLVSLSRMPNMVSDVDLEEIERYVVTLYSRTCPLSTGNEARRSLFYISIL